MLSIEKLRVPKFVFEGKVFPKIKRRVPLGNSTAVENNGNEEDTNDEPSDYVFRIINNNMINNIVQDHNDGKKNCKYYSLYNCHFFKIITLSWIPPCNLAISLRSSWYVGWHWDILWDPKHSKRSAAGYNVVYLNSSSETFWYDDRCLRSFLAYKLKFLCRKTVRIRVISRSWESV